MDAANPFWTYWYFHVPNYVIAALVYTLVARFGLSLFVSRDWPNYIWRFFLRLTDPVLAAVGWVTPSFVHGIFMPLGAVFWLVLLRIALWIALRALDLAPRLAPRPPGEGGRDGERKGGGRG